MDLSNLDIPEAKIRKIDGFPVAYRDMGKGYPVFCFPGWPISSLCYVPLYNLTRKDLRLIAVDFPGWCGNTPSLPRGTSVEKYTTLMHKFVASFKLERFGFMGYSFGNAVLLDLLRRFKDRPEKVVYLSSVNYGPEVASEQLFATLLKLYDAQGGNKANRLLMKAEFLTLFELCFGVNAAISGGVKSPFFQQVLTEAENVDVDAVVESGQSLLARTFVTEKAKLADSLFIYADDDLEVVRKQAPEMARFLNAQTFIVKDDGHRHVFYNPQKSAEKIVMHFLKE